MVQLLFISFKKAHVGVQGLIVKLKSRFFQGDSKKGSKILKERGGLRLQNLHLVNLTSFFIRDVIRLFLIVRLFGEILFGVCMIGDPFLAIYEGELRGSLTQWEDISHLRFSMFVPLFSLYSRLYHIFIPREFTMEYCMRGWVMLVWFLDLRWIRRFFFWFWSRIFLTHCVIILHCTPIFYSSNSSVWRLGSSSLYLVMTAYLPLLI